MTDFIPPQNLLAECSIISGMVQNEAIYYQAQEQLMPHHFYKPSHRKAFEAISGKKFKDLAYILDKTLESDPELTVDDFYGVSYSTTGEEEIKSIIDMYQRREFIISSQNSIRALYSDFETKAVETILNHTTEAARLVSGSDIRTKRVSELLPAEFERVEHVQKHGNYAFIKTGISDIDNATSIAQHDYIVIGARPSNCKSTLASVISRNICGSGGRCLVFYLDTSKGKEVSRALFSQAGVNLHQCNTGMLPKREFPKLSMAAGPLSEYELYFDDTPKLTPMRAAAICKRIISEQGPLSAVFFDFIQNMKPNYQIREIRERVSHISEELHGLPNEINCPVFVLSQMARYQKEEVNPPELNNLKESGDIEEDADQVWLLYYPHKYHFHQQNSPDKKNLLELFIAKYKDGPTGYVPLNYCPQILRISNRANGGEHEYQGHGFED